MELVEINSFVRDYHDYLDIWDATVSEVLILPDNSRDVHAVAVLREGQVVGYIPYNLAPTVELFLRREVNKGFVEVNGARVNRGAGYGLNLQIIWT